MYDVMRFGAVAGAASTSCRFLQAGDGVEVSLGVLDGSDLNFDFNVSFTRSKNSARGHRVN